MKIFKIQMNAESQLRELQELTQNFFYCVETVRAPFSTGYITNTSPLNPLKETYSKNTNNHFSHLLPLVETEDNEKQKTARGYLSVCCFTEQAKHK